MTLVGSFLLMLNMHVQLAVATFALIPLITIALVFNKKMTKVNTQIYDNLGEFNAEWKHLSVTFVTQSFTNETFEHKRFDGLSEIYQQSKILL